MELANPGGQQGLDEVLQTGWQWGFRAEVQPEPNRTGR